MPRRPRISLEGRIYHVYSRFARGAEICKEAGETERFRELLQEVHRRDGLTVFAWVLVSNHYHLPLRSEPVQRGVRLPPVCLHRTLLASRTATPVRLNLTVPWCASNNNWTTLTACDDNME